MILDLNGTQAKMSNASVSVTVTVKNTVSVQASLVCMSYVLLLVLKRTSKTFPFFGAVVRKYFFLFFYFSCFFFYFFKTFLVQLRKQSMQKMVRV